MPLQDEMTVFHACCSYGDLSTIRLLLNEHPSFLNNVDENGNSPLLIACYNDQFEVSKMILEKGPDTCIRNKEGHTALTLSAALGHRHIISLLAKSGVDLNYTNEQGASALIIASKLGQIDCVDTLLRSGADTELRNRIECYVLGNTALIEATLARRVAVMKALLVARADKNAVNEYGYTSLHLALLENRGDEVVKVLLQAGATVEHQGNASGIGPLQLAAREGSLGAVKLLLLRKAKVDAACTVLCNTALMYASIRGFTDIMNVLLGAGANKDAGDIYGNTALTLAVRYGQDEIVMLLVNAGADINITNNEGKTALMIAHENQNAFACDVLENMGAGSINRHPMNRNIRDWAAVMLMRQMSISDVDTASDGGDGDGDGKDADPTASLPLPPPPPTPTSPVVSRSPPSNYRLL